MPSGYQVFLDGEAADDAFYTSLTSLEVEESMDFPGALQLNLPVNRSESGDLSAVAESRFKPLANIAVVTSVDGSAAGGAAAAIGSAIGLGGGNGSKSGPECIFDGFVLSHKLHLERGATNSTLSVWGQDASYLMNLEEKVKEWVDVTDADVANSIFGDYGISPADENTDDDSPSHTESGHSLMQRGSDIQFLRMLARRNGKICRVACKDKPGQRTGYFSKPVLEGDADFTLSLSDPDAWTLESLDLNWDVGRPTSVSARQALFDDDDEDGVSADTSDSGLKLLGERDLASFGEKSMKVLLAAPVDDGGELSLRAQAVLREAAWFVNCEGESDVGRLGGILRAGMLVEITGIGGLHSGKYLVWSVRHTITAESHKMKFVLKRNAVGPADSTGPSLSGLLGGL